MWYIFCDLLIVIEQYSADGEHASTILYFAQDSHFLGKFDINDESKYNDAEKGILLTYFAFTSLSTVGFGDLHPRSDFERLACAFILLFGVAIFSYIMGNFIEILQ